MKHPVAPTTLLVLLFICAQLLGLGLLSASINTVVDENGNIVLDYEATAIGERPETEGAQSLLFMFGGVAVGTILILILAKFKQYMMWKLWFFIAVWISSWIALGVVTESWIAGIVSFVIAAWKMWRPNMIIHNASEVLVYSGIAVLLVPLFDILWASVLLIAIAIYDAIAVWKSKHMISMAKFQSESKLFAGLQLSYGGPKKAAQKHVKKQTKKAVKKTARKSAILGGGDIAFPLIFAGTILQWLILDGYSKSVAYGLTTIMVATSAVSLLILFMNAKKDRFYPAMPFLAVGCFVGLGIIALIA